MMKRVNRFFFFLLIPSISLLGQSNSRWRIAQVERSLSAPLRLESDPLWTLSERIEHYQIPGLIIGVIDDGELDWLKSYGTKEAGKNRPIDASSVFQAASVTKTFTALLAVMLAEEGHLSLDKPVNQYLRDWQLTSRNNRFPTDVTMRQLLSHTAGVNIHGTPGYQEGQPVPTIRELLNGHSPSLTPKVQIVSEPGAGYEYSGGGFWVAQKAMEDTMGKSLQALMKQYIFAPLKMTHSSLKQVWQGEATEDHVYGHQHGRVRGSGFRKYAGISSGGLNTSGADLSRFVIELMKGYSGISDVFRASSIKEMARSVSDANYGLGMIVGRDKGYLHMEHGGVNPGFSSYYFAIPETGDGLIILANSEYPIDILTEISGAVASVYSWPALQPKVVRGGALTVKNAEKYLGKYLRTGERNIAIWIEWKNGKCLAHLNDLVNPMPDPMYDELIAMGEGAFLLKKYNARLQFQSSNSGEINTFSMTYGDGSPIIHTKEN